MGVVGPRTRPAFAYEPFSDDDEEEDAPEPAAEPAEGEVKAEPGVPAPTKAAARTPLDELHIYNVEELSRLEKRELIADAELLDGVCMNDFPSNRDSAVFPQRN